MVWPTLRSGIIPPDVSAQTHPKRIPTLPAFGRLERVLGERASATQRELCEATAMDKVTVNRASKELVERGLVERAPNETDGRSHHLALTSVGRELYAQIVPLALSVEAEIEAILGADEAKALEAMLAKLRARVTEIDKRIG
jgi:DNA-binding MarR family transcriptional regulator